jgi:hypothetical protein
MEMKKSPNKNWFQLKPKKKKKKRSPEKGPNKNRF